MVTGTLDDICPEALLAGMNTTLAYLVICSPAVLAQEERPFQPPFLTPAHRSPCSGVFLPGFFGSEGLRPAISCLAASSRSRIEVFP